MSKVIHVSSKDAFDLLLKTTGRVLVDFSKSEGCIWCKRLAPHFNAAADMVEGTTFVEVDLLAVPDLIDEFGLQSVPTVILFEKGERVAEVKSRTALQIIGEIKR